MAKAREKERKAAKKAAKKARRDEPLEEAAAAGGFFGGALDTFTSAAAAVSAAASAAASRAAEILRRQAEKREKQEREREVAETTAAVLKTERVIEAVAAKEYASRAFNAAEKAAKEAKKKTLESRLRADALRKAAAEAQPAATGAPLLLARRVHIALSSALTQLRSAVTTEDIARAGAQGLIVLAMEQATATSQGADDVQVQQDACLVLGRLAAGGKNALLLAVGAHVRILDAMQRHTRHAGLQEHALGALRSFSADVVAEAATTTARRLEMVSRDAAGSALKAMNMHRGNSRVQTHAIGILRNLATAPTANLVDALFNAMRLADPATLEVACGALFDLAALKPRSLSSNEAQKAQSNLLNAMKQLPDNAQVQRDACGALWHLSLDVDVGISCLVTLDGSTARVLLDAMRVHGKDALVCERVCGVLAILAMDRDENERLAASGALTFVLDALDEHGKDARVLRIVCGALRALASQGNYAWLHIQGSTGCTVTDTLKKLAHATTQCGDPGVLKEACACLGSMAASCASSPEFPDWPLHAWDVIRRAMEQCASDASVQQIASDAVFALASASVGSRKKLVKAGAPERILAVMRQYEDVLLLASACRALGSLALDPACQAQLAGKHAYELVVFAMRQNQDEARLQEYACYALGSLALLADNREQLMTCCRPQTYVAMRKHVADPGVQARACWFLGNLALDAVCRELLVQDSSGGGPLGYLVGALQRHRASAAVVASACVGLANLALDAYSHGSLADGGVRLAIEAAQGHGEDADVQVAACRFISSLADSSNAKVQQNLGDALNVAVRAIELHTRCLPVQEGACRALWRLALYQSEANSQPKMTHFSDALIPVLGAMERWPQDAAVQECSCGFLAALARDPVEKGVIGPTRARILVADALNKHADNVAVQEQGKAARTSLLAAVTASESGAGPSPGLTSRSEGHAHKRVAPAGDAAAATRVTALLGQSDRPLELLMREIERDPGDLAFLHHAYCALEQLKESFPVAGLLAELLDAASTQGRSTRTLSWQELFEREAERQPDVAAASMPSITPGSASQGAGPPLVDAAAADAAAAVIKATVDAGDSSVVLVTSAALLWLRTAGPDVRAHVSDSLRALVATHAADTYAEDKSSEAQAERSPDVSATMARKSKLAVGAGTWVVYTVPVRAQVLIWCFSGLADRDRDLTKVEAACRPTRPFSTEPRSAADPFDQLLDPNGDGPMRIYELPVRELQRLWQGGYTPPLRLTLLQRKVVENAGMTTVIGRSGSGKTLALVARVAWDSQRLPGERQLVVARAGRLIGHIEQLVLLRTGAGVGQAAFLSMAALLEHLESLSPPPLRRPWDPAQFVGYAQFEASWAMLKRRASVGRLAAPPTVSPLTAWTQIRSFIKGSHEAARERRPLTEAEYLKLGARRVPLDVAERKFSHAVFCSYQETLCAGNRWDSCDRVLAAYSATAAARCGARPLYDRIYADEVQDMTQAELALLVQLCGRNPASLFLAGDTAQTVSVGVDFRFDEVRSVVFELCNGATAPKAVPLTINYRSHEKVLSVAGTVIQILHDNFPHAADDIVSDTGVAGGAMPWTVPLWMNAPPGKHGEEVKRNKLAALFRGVSRPTVIVLPSRDAELGTALPGTAERFVSQTVEQFSLSGPFVIDVEQAKGLEFETVLIVDFFSELQNQNAWAGMIKNEFVGSAATGRGFSRPPHELARELKLLYTAITRCCTRLMFVETRRRRRLVPPARGQEAGRHARARPRL